MRATGIRGSGTGPPTLSEVYQSSANSMDVLRLALATTVAVVHASAIAYGSQPMLGNTELGAVAVDGFFVLSGFLITASYLRLQAPVVFLWHRFLRIMPAYWATLVLTACVVAPLMAALEGRAAWSVLSGPDASWHYLTANGLLFVRDFSVAGLPTGTEQPGVVNGALWTLFYEVVCYGLVGVLGLLGLLHRCRWVVAALALAAGTGLLAQELGIAIRGELFLRFFFVFLLGALAYLYRERLPMSGGLALAGAVSAVLGAVLLKDYRVLGGLGFAYLCVWAMACTPRLRYRLRTDLSYGMYVLHYPIETVLVLAGATTLTLVGYTGLSLALTAGLAWLSWTVLESRCLRQRDKLPGWLRRLGAEPAGAARARGGTAGRVG